MILFVKWKNLRANKRKAYIVETNVFHACLPLLFLRYFLGVCRWVFSSCLGCSSTVSAVVVLLYPQDGE